MKMNVLGLLITILLVISGIWIADTIAEMRRLPDCFLAAQLRTHLGALGPARLIGDAEGVTLTGQLRG